MPPPPTWSPGMLPTSELLDETMPDKPLVPSTQVTAPLPPPQSGLMKTKLPFPTRRIPPLPTSSFAALPVTALISEPEGSYR